MKNRENVLKRNSESSEALRKYLIEKGQNHNYYKYYANIEYIKEIKNDGHLYLSCGDDWNDENDKRGFVKTDGSYVNFGKCFSTAMTENVALWLLYGGINGDGGMISFTKNDMSKIKNNTQKIELGYFENGSFVSKDTLGDSFEIYLTDIVYIYEDKKDIRLTRADDKCSGVMKDVINGFEIYSKAYPWHYEKECRLICKVDTKKLKKEYTHLKINLKEIGVEKSLENSYVSPIYDGVQIDDFLPSKLTGQVKWDLCKKCSKKTEKK